MLPSTAQGDFQVDDDERKRGVLTVRFGDGSGLEREEDGVYSFEFNTLRSITRLKSIRVSVTSQEQQECMAAAHQCAKMLEKKNQVICVGSFC